MKEILIPKKHYSCNRNVKRPQLRTSSDKNFGPDERIKYYSTKLVALNESLTLRSNCIKGRQDWCPERIEKYVSLVYSYNMLEPRRTKQEEGHATLEWKRLAFFDPLEQ